MVREYTLQGLCCAHCAAEIENGVKHLDGVLSSCVNLMTSTLSVEVADAHNDGITSEIEKIARKFEPDVVVIDKRLEQPGAAAEKARGHSHAGKSERARIFMIAAGAAIFLAGLIADNFFSVGEYVPLSIFIAAYIVLGGDIVLRALKNIARGNVFDENFLMSAASIGAFLIGEYPEAVGIMLFYQIGEFFQDMAVERSKKSIAELMDIRPDFANLQAEGGTKKVSPETVNIGDTIIVKPGEKIPLDGVVISGESMLDTRALTGESVPRKVSESDEVLSGCVNQTGLLTVKVMKTFGESTVAKIIDLVENAAAKKSPTENFITVFSRYYTPAVVILAAVISVIPPLILGGAWAEWIRRGLIFLVISCPCALVVSIPLGYFGGIGGASKRGVLVKGSNYLEALGNLDIVVFDKTGTLTKGVFNVAGIYPAQNHSEGELLEIASAAETFSNHPIALSIKNACGKKIDEARVTGCKEISGYGVNANFDGRRVLAGSQKLMLSEGVKFTESRGAGTKVYVAADGIFAGCLIISDEIKPDSAAAIASLKSKGVRKVFMLTGDNEQIAGDVAEKLKLDESFAGLLPAQKVEKLEMLDAQKRPKGKLAFVGDGINDAPVLARADVGVAMGGLGSDAAIEAADVVLMTDEPSKLADAIDVAKATKRVVWQNIAFTLSVKGIFLLFGAAGLATMWEAVFADVGVALLAVLNAMRVR